MGKLILPQSMRDELTTDDAQWLLSRVKAWDRNVLNYARDHSMKPSMKLAIAVGKEMLRRRGPV